VAVEECIVSLGYIVRNPFENHGNPVFGEEFIGREAALAFVKQRLIAPRLAGCAGIFGQPRVGKTSIAYQSVLKNVGTFVSRRRIPLKLSIKGFQTCDEFFYSLVDAVATEIARLGWPVDDLGSLTAEAQRMGAGYLLRLQRFFGSILESGYQCVIILDDFDGAVSVFRDRPDCFEKLRVLGSDFRVAWLLLSRRNVYEIEDRATGGSIFAGIVDQLPLGQFESQDMTMFVELLRTAAGDVSEAELARLYEACGHHPHLLAMVASDLVESHCEGRRRPVDEILRTRLTDFLTNFEHTIAVLRDDRRLNKIFQILFGPAIDVEGEDLSTCVAYGLVRLVVADSAVGPEYVAYSPRFGDYLRSIERRHIEGDVWTIWAQTETTLRRLVVETMTDKYGLGWEQEVVTRRPGRRVMIEKWYESQAREERSLGTRSMNAAIDYAHVADLFTLIFDEWASLKQVFGETEAYWRSRADTLIRVRIALAHNRKVFRDQKAQVQGSCEEILRVISPLQGRMVGVGI
jgi:hypothetical protein